MVVLTAKTLTNRSRVAITPVAHETKGRLDFIAASVEGSPAVFLSKAIVDKLSPRIGQTVHARVIDYGTHYDLEEQ